MQNLNVCIKTLTLAHLSRPLVDAKRTGVVCAHCGKTFTPQNERGPVPKYCSRTCQQAAYYARREDRRLALLKAAQQAGEGGAS